MLLEILAAILIVIGVLGLLGLIGTSLLVEIILILVGIGLLLWSRGAFGSRTRP